MDNLTHTVIGFIAGEALSSALPVSAGGLSCATRRNLFLAATMIGGNLPDIDLLYSYRGRSAGQLTYLLEHRGYTHTILGCLILALLLYGGIAAWLHRRRLAVTRSDHAALLGAALLGTALHLAMDALNSYGVHPFWPVQNRWLYGDSIYIVEPLYWVAAASLIYRLRSTAARSLLALVLAAAVAASIASGRVPAVIWLFLLVFMGVMLAIGRRSHERSCAYASAVAVALITASFILAGQIAARRVEAMSAEEFPAAQTIDHVLTPMPADPLCWDVLVLQTSGDQYVSRHAILALAPRLIPAARCGGPSIEQRTLVPQTAPAVRDASAIRWRQFSMPKATLAALVAADCKAAALLRFARAPFAMETATDWLMGDLRFDRGPKPGFSDVRIGADVSTRGRCPWTPPWQPPRAALLTDTP